MTTIKKLAELITDIRIIAGVFATVVGVSIWLTIGWFGIVNRVIAIEAETDNSQNVQESILMQLNELQKQQAVLSQQVTGIDAKSTETNNLVRQLIQFLKQ